jgi:serine/threonine protein kinase
MVESGAKNNAVLDLGSLPPATGDIIAGKYRVESVVGSGGMGVVVAARHLQLGQRVAIKLLRLSGLEPERQLEACARFLREGQAAAGLTSDHVVRIHDVGTLDSGEPFMVMELLRGDDLGALIERQGPAPVSAAVDYTLQACHAVAEAHASGIVHRDLKPSNLFVSIRSDGRATVKVLDFGISKTKSAHDDAFNGNLTNTRTVVGSPYYMSPEQVRDAKRVDVRTDVWSIGMILYELLIGEPAFSGDTLPAICAAIAADTPDPVRRRRPEVPEAIEAIVQKCLAKNPDERFQTVGALVAALTPHAPGASITASADYASSRGVTALSEPFSAKSRHVETLHLETGQPAPPASVAVEAAISVVGPVSGRSPTKLDLPEGSLDSGSRHRAEFGASATLVSSSSKKGAPKAPASSGRGRWLVAVALIGAAVSFSLIALRGSKSSPTGEPARVEPAQAVLPVPARPSPPPVAAPEATQEPPAPAGAASSERPESSGPAPAAVNTTPEKAPPAARPRTPRKARATATTTVAPDPSDIRLER